MDQAEMEQRTKQFALRVIRVVGALPNNAIGQVIRYQLAKAGTSVGANYRAEFISRHCCPRRWREARLRPAA